MCALLHRAVDTTKPTTGTDHVGWRPPTEADTLDGMENPTVDTTEAQDAELLAADELLVEEISIDGMCGVY
jgi:mycofactocin precursor